MGRIARVISSKVDDNNNIICTVEKSFGHNIQVPLYLSPGDNSFPLPEDRVFIIEEMGTGNFIAVGIITSDQGSTEGEKVIYSRDSGGNVKATIYLKDDGGIEIIGNGADIEINGDDNVVLQNGTDFAVRFDEFKTQIDQLKSDLDNHVHTNASAGFTLIDSMAGGCTGSVGKPTVPSTADFTNCKVGNINVPTLAEE